MWAPLEWSQRPALSGKLQGLHEQGSRTWFLLAEPGAWLSTGAGRAQERGHPWRVARRLVGRSSRGHVALRRRVPAGQAPHPGPSREATGATHLPSRPRRGLSQGQRDQAACAISCGRDGVLPASRAVRAPLHGESPSREQGRVGSVRRASPRDALVPSGPAWKVPSPTPCSRTSVCFWMWVLVMSQGLTFQRNGPWRGQWCPVCILLSPGNGSCSPSAPRKPHRHQTPAVARKPRCLTQEQSSFPWAWAAFLAGGRDSPSSPRYSSPTTPSLPQSWFLCPISAPCWWLAELRTLLCR